MSVAFSCRRAITVSTALPIWSSPMLNGGPSSHFCTLSRAATVWLASSPAWSATCGAMSAMSPPKSASAPTSTTAAASAGGQPCRRRNRVGGQSTVEMSRPRTTGSRTPQRAPTTYPITTTAPAMSSSSAETIAILRVAERTRSPRCADGAGACVGSCVVGSAGGRPDPGSLIPMITTHLSVAHRSVAGMPRAATADRVDRDALLEFLRPRHRAVLVTRRASGGPQLSPVTFGLDGEGRVVVSTYPQRAKVANTRRDPAVSLCVLSDEWDDPWVQLDGE